MTWNQGNEGGGGGGGGGVTAVTGSNGIVSSGGATPNITPTYGTATNTVTQGNDSRVVNAVPNTRQVVSGTGLTGGGDLSADRTLVVSYGTTAGTATQGNDSRLGGGAAGTIHAADTASNGAASTLALSDHQHAVSTATSLAAADAAAAAAGTATTIPRGDHKHQVTTAAPSVTVQSDAGTAAAGSASSLIRSDAQILAATATPSALGSSTAAQGTSTSLTRADHIHAITYGTAANTVAQGNDSRITGAEQTANKGAASGYAGLDANSFVPVANLPPVITTLLTPIESADLTDYNPTGFTSGVGALIIQANSGPIHLNSIANGVEGRVLYILNFPFDGSSAIVVVGASGVGATNNQIILKANIGSVTLNHFDNMLLLYTQTRWRQIA